MKFMKNLPKIKDLYIKEIPPNIDIINLAQRYSSDHGTVLLASGGDLDSARFNILGISPWLEIRTKGKTINIKYNNESIDLVHDPFYVLKGIINHFKIDIKKYNQPYPILSGLLGYFSYDLKDQIEELPSLSIDDLNLPDILLFSHNYLFVQDKIDKRTHLIMPIFRDKDLIIEPTILDFQQIESKGFYTDGNLVSNFNKREYMETIDRIKRYIINGDVYQVNMSQRFTSSFFGDEFSLFKTLFYLNPAPFFAYIRSNDHTIISTSPERFLLQKGHYVETRPIKGTRPRGNTIDKDQELLNELKTSKKDDAELSMIVDLLRNDIGKVCKPGSVKVKEHKRVERYKNVFHLISIVEGELSDNAESIDLIWAIFPGGSITGCPKIRAMEIIEELEPNKRHIYTGSIGYLSFHNTMDLSIAIRTATIINNKILFSVGGGIVYDSDPLLEFQETLYKAESFFKALQGDKSLEKNKISHHQVWLNGKFQDINNSHVPIDSLAFQYGMGLFETIRVQNNKVYFLEEHINRLKTSWDKIMPIEFPNLSWEEIISEVIKRNRLEDQLVAVKIITGMGSRDIPPYDRIIVVMCKKYLPRVHPQELGLKVCIYPQKRLFPLAEHKSLNYLYYFEAGKWAKKHGFHEAIILNPDGSISEGNTTNILMIKERDVYVPISDYFLNGIMLKKTLEFLKNKNYNIISKKIYPKELFLADEVLMTNSLIGALRIAYIDNKELGQKDSFIYKDINSYYFGV